MVDYRFPTRIKALESVSGPRLEMEPIIDKQEHGDIMGRRASFSEWVFALALWYLKLRFSYQWSVPNTHYRVDFYIQAAPQYIMVDVRRFSARDASNQRLRKKIIERLMMRPLHVVYDYQLTTFEEGITMARKLTY